MAVKNTSKKGIQIDKATATMVGIVAAASFVTVFSLVASRALLTRRAFQSRVISAKVLALNQLKENKIASGKLVEQYTNFVALDPNVLSGNPKGTGEKDGDNAKIILDSLPSKYDAPALISSLEKITATYKEPSITSTDDEVHQAKADVKKPVPIIMPFTINVTTDLVAGQKLLTTLESSIRPINITLLALSATDKAVSLNISANTYYQPAKTLIIGSKEIR